MKKRVMAILLMMSLLMELFNSNLVNANICDEQIQVLNYGGIEYRITSREAKGIKESIIEYENKKMIISLNDDVVEMTKYKIDNNGKYKIIDENSATIEEVKKSADVNAQFSWNAKKKTPEGWGSVYWYQYGTSSYNNAYMQIGCKATYRIKYWKLSKNKQEACDSYADTLLDCKKEYELGTKTLTAFQIGFFTAAIIASVVTIEVPIGVVVTAVIAIVGGHANAVRKLVESRYDYIKVTDKYEKIKGYGTSV
ncbi:hypothetical protein [Eubacterium sp.]|uniref:hypothetical protein n=1 Tax=Eubacterium sp. TaxID=142586 RepID=UPI0025D6D5B8|nr:hypothetical protein [Eubacterium sp.]MCR5628189.1 hypothetical protein [Eubacterium sp.]